MLRFNCVYIGNVTRLSHLALAWKLAAILACTRLLACRLSPATPDRARSSRSVPEPVAAAFNGNPRTRSRRTDGKDGPGEGPPPG